MAEINVERRERSMASWLIIGALLLIALLWWLLSGNNERDNVAAVTDTTGVVAPGAMGTADPAAATMTPESGTGSMGTAAQPAAVSTFLSYVDERSTQGAVGLDHEYTANGLRQLADAIGAVAERDTVGGAELERQLTALREQADALQRETDSNAHAAQARSAFTSAASMLGSLQDSQASNDTREAAEALSGDRPLTEQGETVQRFFQSAADALRGVTTGTT